MHHEVEASSMRQSPWFCWLVWALLEESPGYPVDRVTGVLALDPCDEGVQGLRSLNWSQAVPFLVLTEGPDPPVVGWPYEVVPLLVQRMRRQIVLRTDHGEVVLVPLEYEWFGRQCVQRCLVHVVAAA
jgi:hypothetical protein